MYIKKFFILLFVFTFAFQVNAYAYESVTYLYAGTTTTYIKNVERTGSNLKTVCPDYFEINSNGTLKTATKADPLFIQSMHAKGIKVTPYLSNNWDRTLGRAAVANRKTFVTELADKVMTLGCDGVNIDIQNLTEADRDTFTDFIRQLRTALPKTKLITVCVAPNPWGVTTGWPASYDYTTLGTLCDQVFVMAYDEHYYGSTPGAVASFSFVEESVKYALNYLSPLKIVIGVPFYGRYWKQGATVGGDGITVSDVERLISICKSTTWYDDAAQCARATVTVSDTDNAVIWGNEKLSAGTYDIWYEDDTSMEKKLSLVSKYGLLGAGSWALGEEPERFWQNYSAWLLGMPFTDIENNWAQSYIIDLYKKGILSGMSSRRFGPDQDLTRAEAAVLLVKILGLQNETSTDTFSDTSGHWAENQISIAKKYGIFKGYAGNLFYPEKGITREEFAVICDKVLFSPGTVDFSQKIYSDVSPETNTWSNKAIIVLSMNNILKGYPNGTFRPAKTINRAEAARVTAAMLGYKGGFTISPSNVKTPATVEPR